MKRALVVLSLLFLTACSGPSKKSAKLDDDSAAIAFQAQTKAKAVEAEAQAKAKVIEIEAKAKAKGIETEAKAAIAAKEAEAKRTAEAVDAARRDASKREAELAARQQQAQQSPVAPTKVQLKARLIPPPVYPPSPQPHPDARHNAEAISAHQQLVAGIRAKYIADVNGVRVAAHADARRRMVKEGVPPEIRDYMGAYSMGKRPRSLTDRSEFILPKFEGWEQWDEMLIWADAEKNFRMALGN